jgi:hypothetical protein
MKRTARPKGTAKPRRAGRPKRAVKPGRATKPKLVKRPAPARRRTPPPPAFPQAVGASVRDGLLFRMVKARAAVLAAIQGMSAATAERPLGEGKWSTRETILHLVIRDQARLREMEAALRGIRPSWDGLDPHRQAALNEEDLAPLRRLSWEDAVRLLHTTRQELMEAVESIEEPAEIWDESHPLGWMFQRLPNHDLHHADTIKRWRTEQGG